MKLCAGTECVQKEGCLRSLSPECFLGEWRYSSFFVKLSSWREQIQLYKKY